MNQITKTAWDLNEKAPNRYQLVYELIELAKKLVDESQMKKPRDDFGFDVEIPFDSNVKKEKPVQHAIMVKASESDDDGEPCMGHTGCRKGGPPLSDGPQTL